MVDGRSKEYSCSIIITKNYTNGRGREKSKMYVITQNLDDLFMMKWGKKDTRRWE